MNLAALARTGPRGLIVLSCGPPVTRLAVISVECRSDLVGWVECIGRAGEI